jgi:hypothetical protein
MDQKVEDMAKQQFDMSNYVDVAERIRRFKEAFPQGSLRPLNPDEPYRIEVIGDRTFIVYIAAAYRHPEDTCPGVGTAWEIFPGTTSFTRDSELMNAETSAWGRAIKASLAASEEPKVASANEVRNRQGSSSSSPASTSGKLIYAKRIAESIATKYGINTTELYQHLFKMTPEQLEDGGLTEDMINLITSIKRGQVKLIQDAKTQQWSVQENVEADDE